MTRSYSSTKRQKPEMPRFQDVSRFTRIINQLDSRDRKLDPQKRRSKWMLVLFILFLLFLASFLISFPDFSHEKIGTKEQFFPSEPENSGQAAIPGFELPVDSFENLLKQHIHESIPETK
ncbi:hypothetical protein [Sunxiuqinia rutila]|uniref:hypothetical protein n=1 Tax=Sunxiuqinia rutila TaxID=1397841 RepID=UPI003D35C311